MKSKANGQGLVFSSHPRLAGRIPTVALAVLLCVGLVLISSHLLPPGIDWETSYRLASLAILSGESPYQVDLLLATPWSVVPLLPLAILPLEIGRAALFWISLAAFAYAAYRLGARPVGVGQFLLSPPVVHCLLNANIEWIPLLGCVLPPQVGLLLLTAKPQTGEAVAVFWVIEAWRKGGARSVSHLLASASGPAPLFSLLWILAAALSECDAPDVEYGGECQSLALQLAGWPGPVSRRTPCSTPGPHRYWPWPRLRPSWRWRWQDSGY